MSETKICPNCGTKNKGLDLVETQGVYICCQCRKIIDAKTGIIVDDDKISESRKSYSKHKL